MRINAAGHLIANPPPVDRRHIASDIASLIADTLSNASSARCESRTAKRYGSSAVCLTRAATASIKSSRPKSNCSSTSHAIM